MTQESYNKQEFRPYRNAKEFIEGCKEHGPYIAQEKRHVLISAVSDNGTSAGDYDVLFTHCLWADGYPIGVRK